MERDYRKEYDNYHSRPEQIANRAKRNKARAIARAAGKVRKRDGKEVDHIKPLSKGGSNGPKNTRVVKRSTNRRKGKK